MDSGLGVVPVPDFGPFAFTYRVPNDAHSGIDAVHWYDHVTPMETRVGMDPENPTAVFVVTQPEGKPTTVRICGRPLAGGDVVCRVLEGDNG